LVISSRSRSPGHPIERRDDREGAGKQRFEGKPRTVHFVAKQKASVGGSNKPGLELGEQPYQFGARDRRN